MQKIHYIRKTSVRVDYTGQLSDAFKRQFPDGRTSFLQLKRTDSSDKGAYYYSCRARIVLPDIYKTGCLKPVPPDMWSVTKRANNYLRVLDSPDNPAPQVGGLTGGVLWRREAELLEKDMGPENINRLGVAPEQIVLIHGDGLCPMRGDELPPQAWYIPVFRLPPPNERQVLSVIARLLYRYGFLFDWPGKDCQELICNPDFRAWLGGAPRESAEAEYQKSLRAIQNAEQERTNLPPLSLADFQRNTGVWLSPDIFLTENDPPSQDDGWLDVRERELYAKNPLECVSNEAVGIDFGTAGTTVAVSNGDYMQLQNISLSNRTGKTENPTILRIRDPVGFLAAYHAREARPNTSFKQISAAVPAQESMLKQDDVYDAVYMTDIKQWANDPERKALLPDREGRWQWIRSRELGQASGGQLNPVEKYAYYIGSSLNRPHNGGIVYLRYLLSFSATYMNQNVERIRESFKRGLWKSLPEAVQKAVKDGRLQFSVELACTEATAYAVASVNRHMAQAAAEKVTGLPDKAAYEKELQEGGLFYAAFDMGGGSLDTAFGLMKKTGAADVPYEFKTLQWGGEAFAGCENLLEDAAFRIFNANYEHMCVQEGEDGTKHSIKCMDSRRNAARANSSFLSNSPQAQFNSRQMVERMRKVWIKMGEKEGADVSDILGESMTLLTEDRKLVTVTFNKSSAKGSGQTSGGNPAAPVAVVRKQAGDSQDANRGGENQANPDGKIAVLQTDFSVEEKEIREFFESRIRHSVELFLRQCATAIEKHPNELSGKTCYILPGGNACQSCLVTGALKAQTRDGFQGIQFQTLGILPTKYDRELEQRNETGSLPTAKSGVVYGILKQLSGWCNVDESERPHHIFHYHIGLNQNGVFDLLADADELSANKLVLVKQCCVSDSTWSVKLRYTRRPEYGLKGQNLPVEETGRLEIPVEPMPKTMYLFCRRARDSDCKLDFLLSPGNPAPEENKMRHIGTFDLSE